MNETEIQSLNPANGEIVGTVNVTPIDEITIMVARARSAQSDWSGLGIEGRREALLGAGERMIAAAPEIGRLLTKEMGKPLAEGEGEVRGCGAHLAAELDEMVAALAPQIIVEGRTHSTIHHDPYGVCVAITPWNFPFAMPHWLVLPALMAGNTVILKPSEETPLIGQAYADLLGADLPPGVLQVVHGAEVQGRTLVESPVDLIAFTGSLEVGKGILAQAAGSMRRVILELGGKDPLIVMRDADIGQAARFAARNSFRNAGQVCVSTERIYVHEDIADEFSTALVAEARALQVGSGLDPETQIGPMVSRRQRDHVVKQVESAIGQGAQLLIGGTLSEVGHFMTPAVIDHVDHTMSLATAETFGPVASIIRVPNHEEAVRLANDTPFGLGAVVFGGDITAAESLARRLDAGMVGVNRGVGGASGTPWVGARQSGYGYHKSVAGHRQFAQVRVLSRKA